MALRHDLSRIDNRLLLVHSRYPVYSLIHRFDPTRTSGSVSEPRTLVTQLRYLLITHPGNQMVLLALLAADINPTKRKPQHRVANNRKPDHRHRNTMALNKPWSLGRWVNLHLVSFNPSLSFGMVSLTKADMIPAQFPMLNCNPVALVRLPYRGRLVGSHASGNPTHTYKPIATRKHPA